MEVNATIAQRNGTHGNFEDNGRVMQTLKDVIHRFRLESDPRGAGTSMEYMQPYQREALDMIMLKVGRILCGDPNFADHWHDIAGYAKLCEDRCQK